MLMKGGKMKVLFSYSYTSARSQIAKGLLRHFYGERYEIFSAGVNPTQVNQLVDQPS